MSGAGKAAGAVAGAVAGTAVNILTNILTGGGQQQQQQRRQGGGGGGNGVRAGPVVDATGATTAGPAGRVYTRGELAAATQVEGGLVGGWGGGLVGGWGGRGALWVREGQWRRTGQGKGGGVYRQGCSGGRG